MLIFSTAKAQRHKEKILHLFFLPLRLEDTKKKLYAYFFYRKGAKTQRKNFALIFSTAKARNTKKKLCAFVPLRQNLFFHY
jgi:hypothetical protein